MKIGLSYLLFGLLLLAVVLLMSNGAFGHPGGVDKDGCHTVQKDYKYKDGKVLKAGTRHCHRPLGKTKFDGKELMETPDEPPQKGKAK